MHTNSSAALVAIFLPLTLQAQDLPEIRRDVTRVDGDGLIVATCSRGQGCDCYISNASLETLQTQARIDPPEGIADPMLVYDDGDYLWTTESPHAIDLVYGGDGLCDPAVFSAAELELPLNGTWELTLTDHQLSGCPDMVASAISGEVIVGQSEQRQITWPRPFDMSPLTAGNPTANAWVNRGGDLWSTEVFNESGDLGGNARVAMTARILSQREIAVTSTFSTDALAAMTGETCTSTTFSTLRWRG